MTLTASSKSIKRIILSVILAFLVHTIEFSFIYLNYSICNFPQLSLAHKQKKHLGRRTSKLLRGNEICATKLFCWFRAPDFSFILIKCFRRESLTDEHANLSDLPITVNVEGPSRHTSTEDVNSVSQSEDHSFQKPPKRYSNPRFSRPFDDYSIEESDSEFDQGQKMMSPPGKGYIESSRTITPITEQPPSPDYSSSPDEDSPTNTQRTSKVSV